LARRIFNNLFFNFAAQDQLDAMIKDDPERAKALRKAFMDGRQWKNSVQVLRTYSSSVMRDSSVKFKKKNKLSFFRHFLTAGFEKDEVSSFWKGGKDEKGRKLKKCRNKRGEKCYKIRCDDEDVVTHRKSDGISGVVVDKRLHANEAKLVFAHDARPGDDTSAEEDVASEETAADDDAEDGNDSDGEASESEEGAGASSDGDAEDDNDEERGGASSDGDAEDDSDEEPGGSAEDESEEPAASSKKRKHLATPSPRKKKGVTGSSGKKSKQRDRRHHRESKAFEAGTSAKQMKREIDQCASNFKKSAHGFAAAKKVKAYVNYVISKQVCNGKPIDVFVKDCATRFGNRDQVKALDLGEVTNAMDNAKSQLNEYRDGIDKWPYPCNFAERRDTLHARVASWKDACAEARLHTDALCDMVADAKAADSSLADKWRKCRNKIRQWYVELKVAACVSKVAADLIQAAQATPASCKMSLEYPGEVFKRTTFACRISHSRSSLGSRWDRHLQL